MQLHNENGAAYIVVLAMLVLVGGLTATLLNVSTSNIRFSMTESDHARAFYAADAGVEYIKHRSAAKSFDQVKDLEFNLEGYILDDNLKFETGIIAAGEGSIKFKSTGIYSPDGDFSEGNIKSVILIDYAISGSDAPFQIEYSGDDIKRDKVLKGKAGDLYDDGYVYINENLAPARDFWFPADRFNYDYVIDANNHELFAEEYEKFYQRYESAANSGSKFSEEFSVFIETDGGEFTFSSGNQNNDSYEDHILNTIIVIDGDLSVRPHNKFENSIIVVGGSLKFDGVPTEDIINSMFFVYGDVELEESGLQLGGQYDIDESWIFGHPQLDSFDLYENVLLPGFKNWRSG